VEVDAIEPAELRRLVNDRIESLIDPVELDRVRQIEGIERFQLLNLAERFGQAS
jgi:hypothetical protein